MPAWIMYALLAAFFAAAVTMFAKAGLAEVDTVTATTIRSVVMAAFLLLLAAGTGKLRVMPSTGRTELLWIVASGVAGALSWLCYFLALRYGPAPAVAALDRTSVVFVLLGASLWFAEPLTVRTVLGAVLVTLGAALLVRG